MTYRSRLIPLAAVAASALALTACSASTPTSPASSNAGASSDVSISLVRQLGSGDYFELWLQGAKAEADKLGITLNVSDANGQDAQQATDLESAVNANADAIIVDHGFADTIQPGIKDALDANIPVVAFDVDAGDDRAVTVDQSDAEIGKQITGQLLKDTGGTANVIYVYVAGFAPLDKRNTVWEDVKKANPGLKQVAQVGVVNDNTAAEVDDQVKAALQANPDVTAILAPYDEFAKGATLAVNELKLQDTVKVYGADISTPDIGVITAENSPWVATSATDPSNVGAVAVRAAYLKATGGTVDQNIEIPPALITQSDLVSGKVTTLEELTAAVPSLATPDVAAVK